MATLTSEQRWDIVKAWKKTNSIAATSRINGVSKKAVRTWVQRYRDTGDVLDKQRPGAKRMLNDAVCAVAMDLILSPTFGDAATVSEELFARGLTSKVMHGTSVAMQVKNTQSQWARPSEFIEGDLPKTSRKRPRRRGLHFAEQTNRGIGLVSCSLIERSFFSSILVLK